MLRLRVVLMNKLDEIHDHASTKDSNKTNTPAPRGRHDKQSKRSPCSTERAAQQQEQACIDPLHEGNEEPDEDDNQNNVHICSLCEEMAKQEHAVCHCQKCGDHLCSTYRDAHSRMRMIKGHIVRKFGTAAFQLPRIFATKGRKKRASSKVGLLYEGDEPSSGEGREELGLANVPKPWGCRASSIDTEASGPNAGRMLRKKDGGGLQGLLQAYAATPGHQRILEATAKAQLQYNFHTDPSVSHAVLEQSKVEPYRTVNQSNICQFWSNSL